MINKLRIQQKTEVKKMLCSFQKKIISVLVFLLIPMMSYASTDTVSAAVINFSEFEKGTGTHPMMMTVTDKFLRIDDSIMADDSIQFDDKLDKGFVLYDRNEKIIYSVSAEEQQIVKIKLVPVTIPSPIELKLHSVTLAVDKDAPLIDGKKIQNLQLFVNNKLCYNLLAVPGLMPDVVAAMGEFNQVLAGQQSDTLQYIPADLHEACDLARHTFFPQNQLKYGFPIMLQAMDETGKTENIKYSRMLINFKQKMVPAELFVLPKYTIIPIN